MERGQLPKYCCQFLREERNVLSINTTKIVFQNEKNTKRTPGGQSLSAKFKLSWRIRRLEWGQSSLWSKGYQSITFRKWCRLPHSKQYYIPQMHGVVHESRNLAVRGLFSCLEMVQNKTISLPSFPINVSSFHSCKSQKKSNFQHPRSLLPSIYDFLYRDRMYWKVSHRI